MSPHTYVRLQLDSPYLEPAAMELLASRCVDAPTLDCSQKLRVQRFEYLLAHRHDVTSGVHHKLWYERNNALVRSKKANMIYSAMHTTYGSTGPGGLGPIWTFRIGLCVKIWTSNLRSSATRHTCLCLECGADGVTPQWFTRVDSKQAYSIFWLRYPNYAFFSPRCVYRAVFHWLTCTTVITKK